MTRGARNYSRVPQIYLVDVVRGKTQPPSDSGYKGAGACAVTAGCCRMLCTCSCKAKTSLFRRAIWCDRLFGMSRAPDTEMTDDVFGPTGVFCMRAALAANGLQIPAAERRTIA